MASQADVPLLVRRFDGVNIADEPVFIGSSYLQASDNWVPDLTYQLATRRGTALYQPLPGVVRVDALLRTYDTAGHRYLYAVGLDPSGVGQLFVMTDDGPPVAIGAPYGARNARYGMAVLGQSLYVGNGVDFIRKVSLGALTDETLAPLAVTDDTGQAVAGVADPTTTLQTGTYSYAWGVYDTAAKVWVSVGPSHTTQLTGTGNSLSFTAPTPVLPANQTYHVFVTFPDAAVETAWDQVPEGLAATNVIVVRNIVFESTPIPIAEVGRRGRILVAHRGRIWFAGDQQKPSRVFATSTVVPGLEQAIFDIGDFFPWDAEEPVGEGDGDVITGLAVAALTSTQKSPTSPLAILKQNSTWLFLGDITGDPASDLVQISGKVGCIAPDTVVSTRWGVVFCGRDSVYLLPASLTEPLDIGWPIAPAIVAIPPNAAANAFAFYQKGFYVLCIAPAGKTENVTMWMLDMRRGPGAPRSQGPTPSWWGPHDVPAYTAGAVGTQDPQRVDRTFLALLASSVIGQDALWNFSLWNSALWTATRTGAAIVENDQPTATDAIADGNVPQTIVSQFKSAALDNGDAFGRKVFQRARLRGRAATTTNLEVCLLVDEVPEECRTGQLPGGGNALWNSALWNSALWGGPGTIAVAIDVTDPDPALRPDVADGLVFGSVDGRVTGYQGELVVTHREPVLMTLRDLELRYLPRDRPIP
jgi:hypothetical protein